MGKKDSPRKITRFEDERNKRETCLRGAPGGPEHSFRAYQARQKREFQAKPLLALSPCIGQPSVPTRAHAGS